MNVGAVYIPKCETKLPPMDARSRKAGFAAPSAVEKECGSREYTSSRRMSI